MKRLRRPSSRKQRQKKEYLRHRIGCCRTRNKATRARLALLNSCRSEQGVQNHFDRRCTLRGRLKEMYSANIQTTIAAHPAPTEFQRQAQSCRTARRKDSTNPLDRK